MDHAITIRDLLHLASIAAVGYILSAIAAIFYILHMLSGGYWPRWYWNLKQRNIHRKSDLTTLNLS